MTAKTDTRTSDVPTNSLRAWLLASRPKTLAGAVAPVVLALAAAWADAALYAGGREANFHCVPAVLCMAFALLMQVDANFVNDYFDFVRGRDDAATRLGPERACAQGWITPHAMARGIALTTVVAALTGLPLVLWGGLEMIGVGALCLLFCFLYTTSLAQHGLGDLLVVVFFGIVPVCTTYYIQLHTLTPLVIALSVSMGLATDCLLIINNYRDRDQDAAASKRTLVTRIGPRATERLYLALGMTAVAVPLATAAISVAQQLSAAQASWKALWLLLPIIYLIPHTIVWKQMARIHSGRGLNAVLGRTSACILLYAILEAIATVLTSL